MPQIANKTLVLLLFFCSGFSGLVYEVVWMRRLSLVFGNTVYASSTVLAGFMGGLAIGGFLFGKIADKTRRPLRVYGFLELAVGAFALGFPILLDGLTPLYLWFARASGAGYQCLSFAQAILLVLLLLVPTTLMGGTLPLLTRHLARQPELLGRNLGLLYGLNTWGAVLGCAGAGFIFIATFGVRATNWVAVAVTISVGLVALALGRQKPVPDEPALASASNSESDSLQDKTDPEAAYPGQFVKLMLVLLGIAGLTGMAYEVLWTRVLTFLTGGTTYSFTIMLTTYLCGLALGGVLAAKFVDKSNRLALVFGLLQLFIGLGVLATLVVTPTMLAAVSNLIFHEGAMRYGDFTSYVVLESSTSLLFIFPGAVLMGMTFPVAAKIYGSSRRQTGSTAGTTYFADTIGAIAGSLGAGFLLIPKLGTLSGLIIVAVLNVLIGVVALSYRGDRPQALSLSKPRLAGLLVAVLAIGVLGRNNIPADTFAGIFTAPNSRLAYINEDIGGTVTIEDYGDHRTISINGVNVAGTDLKFATTQKLQAHLALLIHPHPEKVLQIGFGSGGTAWSITRHPVKQVDCVEITAAVIKARDHFKDSNHGVLEDPRVRVMIDDARSYLVKTDQKYDAILSDSIHPRRAGNGGLYCTDYYRLCRERLNTNGIFSAWLPYHGLALEDFRVAVRSLKEVFPHVYLFHSPMGRTEWTIILGTLQPLQLDVASISRKLAIPTVRDDLKAIQVERVEDITSCFLLGDGRLKDFLGSNKALNTDDFPYLEYIAPRSSMASSRQGLLTPIYSEFVRTCEDVTPYIQGADALPAIQQASASEKRVLDARLMELTDPTNCVQITSILRTALQVDPRNNIAKNLLEIYKN